MKKVYFPAGTCFLLILSPPVWKCKGYFRNELSVKLLLSGAGRAVFSIKFHGQDNGGKCAAQFPAQQGGKHIWFYAEDESGVGGQQAGAAYQKGACRHFPFFIHIGIQGKDGESAHKTCQHCGQTDRSDSEPCAKAGEWGVQQAAQQFRGRKASEHDDAD